MKIYTSYFGNLRKLQNAGLTPISIARYSPRWFSGIRFTTVSPTSYMLSTACSHQEYLRKYKDILDSLNPNDVINSIVRLSDGKDAALLCYEKPGDFCHRHLLAEWLTEKTGIQVEEFQFIKVPEKKPVKMPSLFD